MIIAAEIFTPTLLAAFPREAFLTTSGCFPLLRQPHCECSTQRKGLKEMGFVGNPSASPVGPLTPCCGNKCAGHAQWEGSGLWGASGKPAIRNPGSAPPPPPPSTCMRLGLRSPAPHPPQCLGLVFPACLHADIQAGGGRVRRPGQSPEHARGSPGHGLWVLTTTRSQGSTRLLLDAFLGPGKPAYPEVPTGRSQLGGGSRRDSR